MNAVRDRASLSPSTVKKISKDEINSINKKNRKNTRRVFATQVKTTCWSDGVDPRIIAAVRAMKVAPARIQKISATEVIIHNNPIWGNKK